MTQFEKTFEFMKKTWVILLYAILVILSYIFVDKTLATYFHQLDLRTNIHALSILTAFGQWIVYIGLFFCAAVYFRYVRTNPVSEARAWYLLGCVLVANLVCFVLKVALSRARPDLLFSSNEFGFYWFRMGKYYWSFPSGHTTTVVSLAVGLGVLFPRYFYAALGVALLVAASRVLLYYHYLSDVMTGFYLTVLVVGFYTHYLKQKNWFEEKGCIDSKPLILNGQRS
ncbi:phosphatase PAP2 family protein [Legionella rowbothamii]|uniref:phosphatase PAP2 family protein n=1 Tax=Legionella rowbothamii TaxID=96229 RepID=UPI00105472FE|nr:phosphatase PAP2 family protein [Legionella rowbothamii]